MFRKIKYVASILVVSATLSIGVSSASAKVVVNERLPFSFPFFNACTGEEVWVEGIFHNVGREKIGEDGSIVFNGRINAHGLGTGLESGAEYVWNDTFETEVEEVPGVSFSFTDQTYLRLIGKGQTPNLFLRGVIVLRVEFDPFDFFIESIEDISCIPD